MTSIGILSYGSLIEEPGIEIKPLIIESRTGIQTPFPIEFARSSSTRSNAPTVIPVVAGGCRVKATIHLLDKSITLEQAEDLLWRRETRNEHSEKHFRRQSKPSPNTMAVNRLSNFHGIDIVIYTSLSPNIANPSPAALAELAVKSAKSAASKVHKDGISYLISLKRQGISTPLMPAYETEILKITSAVNLEEALEKCRGNDSGFDK